jgi:uncharacterized protein (DUF1778 family)
MDSDGAPPYIDGQEDSSMPTRTVATHIDTPIGADLNALLKRAAEIHGVTMTDVVVAAVQEAAQRTVAQSEVIRLSLADSERFAEAILSPPPPSPALDRAFARRRQLLGGARGGRPVQLGSGSANRQTTLEHRS